MSEAEIITSLINTLRRITSSDPNNGMYAVLVRAEAAEAIEQAEEARAALASTR